MSYRRGAPHTGEQLRAAKRFLQHSPARMAGPPTRSSLHASPSLQGKGQGQHLTSDSRCTPIGPGHPDWLRETEGTPGLVPTHALAAGP